MLRVRKLERRLTARLTASDKKAVMVALAKIGG